MPTGHLPSLPLALSAIALASFVTGCRGGETPKATPDAAGDAASREHCTSALAGDGPFAAVLSGPATFSTNPPMEPWGSSLWPRTQNIAFTAYFPAGRLPGQRVLLAAPFQLPRPGLAVAAAATLDDTRSAAGLIASADHGNSLRGTLLGPDDGIVGEVLADLVMGMGDVVVTGHATVKLCPIAEPPPAPRLDASDTQFGPTSSLRFVPSAPVDEGKLGPIKVRSGGKDVAIGIRGIASGSYEDGALLITADSAFPPNLPVTIDAGGLTDVIGRPVTVSPPPAPLVVQSEIADLTFATAPPPGSVVTSGSDPAAYQVRDGKLMLGTVGDEISGFDPALPIRVTALAGLGDPGDRTRARFRYDLRCFFYPTMSFTTIHLVAAGGESVAVPVICGNGSNEVVVDLPSKGPLFLSVVMDPPWSRSFNGSFNGLAIDAITFE